MKTNVAVFYGCRSVEHEVSIISAVQAMHAIDKEKYTLTPVYVAKTGEMYTGETVHVISKDSGDYWYVYSDKLGKYGYTNKNYLY